MDLKRTERLLKLLEAHGVEYLKTADIEIRLAAPAAPAARGLSQGSKLHPKEASGALSQGAAKAAPGKPPPPAAAIPPVENEIPHHVNEVQKLLKLSDNELVDRLFPDPSQVSEAGPQAKAPKERRHA